MNFNFYLIEDDPVSRRMLNNLIDDSGFGQVVGESDDGSEVYLHMLKNVDIILIDLLMPKRDGIETIRALKNAGCQGKFIMISQIENKQMVGEAYLVGVEYFIHKPINRLEVLAVLGRVIESLRLKKSLVTIRESLADMEEPSIRKLHVGAKGIHAESVADRNQFTTTYYEIAGEIGLWGESGAQDIERCLMWLRDAEKTGGRFEEISTLQTLYQNVLGGSSQSMREVKAMEQRIRRAVFAVLTHLAALGLSDFGNPTFEHFAPRLFEFSEVRQRMKELEEEEMHTKCKVNIRKFLLSMYAELNRTER